MMHIPKTIDIPLEVWRDDTIRVKGGRLLLEMITNAHNRGESPELIFESFAGVAISDIYLIIGYYLKHKTEIDELFEDQRIKAEVKMREWQK